MSHKDLFKKCVEILYYKLQLFLLVVFIAIVTVVTLPISMPDFPLLSLCFDRTIHPIITIRHLLHI